MKCSVKRNQDCADGNHNFIVSRWLVTGQAQAASGFTCQKCLLSVDGKKDIEDLKRQIDEQHNAEISEASGKVPRNKGNKGPGGEK